MKISLSALIALICLTFIWGFNWLVMKSVLPYVGAFDFAAMRCLLGTALLFLLLKIGKYNMTPPPFLPTFLLGILQTAGMVGFAQWALVEGGAGKVAILTYTMPFWVIILARVFLNEQLKRQHYFATSIAIVGMLLLLQPWSLIAALSRLSLRSAPDCLGEQVPFMQNGSISVIRSDCSPLLLGRCYGDHSSFSSSHSSLINNLLFGTCISGAAYSIMPCSQRLWRGRCGCLF